MIISFISICNTIRKVDNKRLLMYETENGDLMKDGMTHFSFASLQRVKNLPVRGASMKDISPGIYHKDHHQYGKRLM